MNYFNAGSSNAHKTKPVFVSCFGTAFVCGKVGILHALWGCIGPARPGLRKKLILFGRERLEGSHVWPHVNDEENR
jgi:hypothetical protein